MQIASIQRWRGWVFERMWRRARRRLEWIWKGWALIVRVVRSGERGYEGSEGEMLLAMAWARVSRSGYGRPQV